MNARTSLAVWLGVALVFAAAVVLPLWLAFDGAPTLPDGLASSPGLRDQGPAGGERLLSGPHGGNALFVLHAAPSLVIVESAATATSLSNRDVLRAPGHLAANEARLL